MVTQKKALVLRPPKSPNQPIAPVDYDQRFQDQFSNALRLYFNEIDNFDRIVAFSLAVSLAMKMDPVYGAAGEDDERIKSLYVKRARLTLFPNQISAFSRRKQKLFV